MLSIKINKTKEIAHTKKVVNGRKNNNPELKPKSQTPAIVEFTQN
jgi:hypothetical protein